MDLIVDDGLDLFLKMLINKDSELGLQARLWIGSTTPSFGSHIGDFTECSNAGYAPINFSGSSWTGSTASGSGTYSYPAIDFNFLFDASPQTIAGYMVIAPSVSKLLWVGKFATPYAIPGGGGTLTLNLDFLGQSIPT